MKKPNIQRKREERSKERRRSIVQALRQLMTSKGYAETSLTDIAIESGLSVSHVLYYFKGKEGILEELCKRVVAGYKRDLTAHLYEPPEERIHVFVAYSFAGPNRVNQEYRLGLELLALSLHRPAIRKMMAEMSDATIEYLTDLFSQVPRQPAISAEEAAESAAGLWQGLLCNVQFDEGLDENRARRLLRRALLYVSGLTGGPAPDLVGSAKSDNASRRGSNDLLKDSNLVNLRSLRK
jgi:AcrR family transcriptional regulator